MVITDEERVLLRPGEAASVLGVSRSKLYSLILANEIPSVRVTGSVRVPRRALMEWIEAQTILPAAASPRRAAAVGQTKAPAPRKADALEVGRATDPTATARS